MESNDQALFGQDEATSETSLLGRQEQEHQYRKVFAAIGNFAIAITFTSPMMGLMIMTYYQVVYGGYCGLTWGWIIPTIFFLPQVFAMAELCSSMPDNGALYWWAAALAPPKLSRPVSFISGWTIFAANVAAVAAFSFAIGSSYTAVIAFLHPGWDPTPAQNMAIAMVIIVFWALLNLMRMENLSIIFNSLALLNCCTAVFFIIAIPISHAAQGKSFTSAHIAFTQYTNYSDWSRAAAIPITFYGLAWVCWGWHCPAFIVEETQNARVAAPKAIVASYILTATLGFLVCLSAALCIDDMDALAAGNLTFPPFYTLIITNLGTNLGSALLLTVISCTAVGGGSIMFTISSQLAAFARDGGLPFSKVFAYVDPRTNMPFPAMMLICITAFVMLLFSLSPTAGHVLYSLPIIALYITMVLPIALRLVADRRYVPGPFNFGKLSWSVHFIALISMLFMIAIECLPLSPHWTKETFNYNWCLSLGTILLAAGLWRVHGKQHYKGVNLDALKEFRVHPQLDWAVAEHEE